MKKFLLLLSIFSSAVLNAQWIEQTTDTSFLHQRLYFQSASKGIIVGLDGVYQRTYDGGLTWDTGHIELDDWSLCARSPYPSNLSSVDFLHCRVDGRELISKFIVQ